MDAEQVPFRSHWEVHENGSQHGSVIFNPDSSKRFTKQGLAPWAGSLYCKQNCSPSRLGALLTNDTIHQGPAYAAPTADPSGCVGVE